MHWLVRYEHSHTYTGRPLTLRLNARTLKASSSPSTTVSVLTLNPALSLIPLASHTQLLISPCMSGLWASVLTNTHTPINPAHRLTYVKAMTLPPTQTHYRAMSLPLTYNMLLLLWVWVVGYGSRCRGVVLPKTRQSGQHSMRREGWGREWQKAGGKGDVGVPSCTSARLRNVAKNYECMRAKECMYNSAWLSTWHCSLLISSLNHSCWCLAYDQMCWAEL